MKNAWAVALGAAALAIGPLNPIDAQQGAPSGVCRVSGRATSGATPLPGVTVTVKSGEAVKGATSTDPDGSYHVNLPAGRLSAHRRSHRVRAGRARALRERRRPARRRSIFSWRSRHGSRTHRAARGAAPAPAAANTTAGRSNQPVTAANGRGTAPGANGTAAGRGQRFETLAVQTQARRSSGTRGEPARSRGRGRRAPAAARLLDGGTDAGRRDHRQHGESRPRHDQRSAGGDRPRRVRSGHWRVRAGLRVPARADSAVDSVGLADPAVLADAGALAAPAGRAAVAGGPGGQGGFALGGRGGRQNAYSFTSNYTFGGSVLDSAPYQLHPDSPVTQQPYTRQTLRRHRRRPGEDPARLRRHAAHQLHADLHGQPRREPVRSVRDRADRRDARRRLLGGGSHGHQPGDRPAVRRQPDSRRV